MRRFPARVLLSTGGSMFAIVAVPFEAFQALPPFEFKLMAAVLRYVNRQGECCPALYQLAADVGSSEATVSRGMSRLEQHGCFTRERQGNGRYLYRIGERFLARRIGKPKIDGNRATPSNRPHLAPVQDSLSHGARQEVTPSSDQRSSEGEQQPSQQDEIPDGWKDAAAAERRLAGLPEVDYRVEWRKLVAYSEGARITIWRWRGWVLKARGDRAAVNAQISAITASPIGDIPGDDREQRQARGWVKRGFWLRDGSWGAAPDQLGCNLPPDLVAWCLRERQAQIAA